MGRASFLPEVLVSVPALASMVRVCDLEGQTVGWCVEAHLKQ